MGLFPNSVVHCRDLGGTDFVGDEPLVPECRVILGECGGHQPRIEAERGRQAGRYHEIATR